MLTKMYLTNFLSFLDRTEFDFTASKYSILGETNVYNNEILKGALFIGPNASGKSNALSGIAFLIKLIKDEGTTFANYRCFFAKKAITTVEYEFVFSHKLPQANSGKYVLIRTSTTVTAMQESKRSKSPP